MTFFRKLGWWRHRARRERELREELQFHLDEETESRLADGLGPDEAERAARLHLGNRTLVEEQVRAVWTWTLLEQLAQDLGYAIRGMRHHRAFTGLTVLSLALGIGANTAIYSVMDAVLLRALPVRDQASLVVLNWHSRVATRDSAGDRQSVMHSMSGSVYDDGPAGLVSGIFPYPAFELLRRQSDAVFSTLFAYYPNRGANLLIDGQADVGRGEYVSGTYFAGVGTAPAAGRLLVPGDDGPGAPQVLVISHAFGERHFGAPDRAVGRTLVVNNLPFTIVGVTAPQFFGVDPSAAPDFFLPMHANLLVDGAGLNGVTAEQYTDEGYYWVEMMARLRPGVTRGEAEAALAPVFHQWVQGTAKTPEELTSLPALRLVDGARGLDRLRRDYSRPLLLLFMVVVLILALACANTANLLLARGTARTREMAVRLSIGAGRVRIVRQLLTESLLLASISGAVGLALAAFGVRVLALLLAGGRDVPVRVELNWHVLLATLAVSMLCGVLFGLAPALRSTRPDVMPALKDARPGAGAIGTGVRRVRPGRALVVSQVAIALVLVLTAGLFVRTLTNLRAVDLGFNPHSVLLFDVNARQAGHEDPEIAAYYERLRARMATIPGVEAATLSRASIISAGTQLDIRVAGRQARGTRFLTVGPGFFTAMQIPMLLGREIDERDRTDTAPVVVVNQRFAELNFGAGISPIGRQITLGGPRPRGMEIVGVSANVRYQGVKEDFVPVVFVPYDQGDWPPLEAMTFALRTTGDPMDSLRAAKEVVRQADPRVPVTDARTQPAEIDQSINREIVFARLCSAFAALGLIIAMVGLYGVTSYGIARRTGEIGIRIALGARGAQVLRMVMREVVTLGAAGLAIGVPVALAGSRLVESFLFGLTPTDPVTIVLAATILATCVVVAGYVPARRASRIDPATALRHE